MSTYCSVCGSVCQSPGDCAKMQKFQELVKNAQELAKVQKQFKISIPNFKGNSKWFTNDEVMMKYELKPFTPDMKWKYRFLTVTFDPKKFTFNKLTQPKYLLNYFFSAMYDLRKLFMDNVYIVIEYHKSGIPHFHINYSCETPLEQSTLLLRMQYYFAKDMRNKHAINDRIFNEGGPSYIQKLETSKPNTHYYEFKQEEATEPDDIDQFLDNWECANPL